MGGMRGPGPWPPPGRPGPRPRPLPRPPVVYDEREHRSAEEILEPYRSESRSDQDHTVADSDSELLIRAMCNAAKADGSLDKDERERIMNQVGTLSTSEATFLRSELTSARVAVDDLADSIPADLREVAYTVSLMAISFDSISEKEYLRDLATALEITDFRRDTIHADLSIPLL